MEQEEYRNRIKEFNLKATELNKTFMTKAFEISKKIDSITKECSDKSIVKSSQDLEDAIIISITDKSARARFIPNARKILASYQVLEIENLFSLFYRTSKELNDLIKKYDFTTEVEINIKNKFFGKFYDKINQARKRNNLRPLGPIELEFKKKTEEETLFSFYINYFYFHH